MDTYISFLVNCDEIAINFNGDEEVLFEKFVFRVTFVTTPQQHQNRLKQKQIQSIEIVS